MSRGNRPDQNGTHRAQFDKNKKKIYATQKICGICGKPVDFSLKWPDPMSKSVDHIIPVSKGGHPSAMENLQLAHVICNKEKSNRLLNQKYEKPISNEPISNRILPQSMDWKKYRSKAN